MVPLKELNEMTNAEMQALSDAQLDRLEKLTLHWLQLAQQEQERRGLRPTTAETMARDLANTHI